MVTLAICRRVTTFFPPPAVEVDDLTRSATIDLHGTLARPASDTARVSAYDIVAVVGGGDALLARRAMRAGARL